MADTVALEILAREDYDEWHAFKRSAEGPIDLTYCKFSNTTLSHFDFSGCDFDGAHFDDCDLRNANFSHIFARNATFRKCMLSDATFYRASLQSADFDRCEIDSTDFSHSYDLTYDSISKSYYDNNTKVPFDLANPDNWLDVEDDEAEFDEDRLAQSLSAPSEGENSVTHSDYIPNIPKRVVAPLETVWRKKKLYVDLRDCSTSLGELTENRLARELRVELERLCSVLEASNFDQRIVADVRFNLEKFPRNGRDFKRKVISVWFSFRPIFEYMKLTKGQHSDYVEAKVISFELNLRDSLSSYEEFRQYELETQAVKPTENFDNQQFIAAQIDFSKSLKTQVESVDSSVTVGTDRIIELQSRAYQQLGTKSLLYGAASTFANIMSRIFVRAINEAIDGAMEGIRESTKKLVVTTMTVGGGILLWLMTSGLGSFAWLKHAWEYVRSIVGI